MKLDKFAFVAWLNQTERRVVGQVENPCKCPIATWLSDVHKLPVYIGESQFFIHAADDVDTVEAFLPRWALRFITAVDSSGERGAPITKEAALTIMAQIMIGRL